jgi:hypothetical protein
MMARSNDIHEMPSSQRCGPIRRWGMLCAQDVMMEVGNPLTAGNRHI